MLHCVQIGRELREWREIGDVAPGSSAWCGASGLVDFEDRGQNDVYGLVDGAVEDACQQRAGFAAEGFGVLADGGIAGIGFQALAGVVETDNRQIAWDADAQFGAGSQGGACRGGGGEDDGRGPAGHAGEAADDADAAGGVLDRDPEQLRIELNSEAATAFLEAADALVMIKVGGLARRQDDPAMAQVKQM